MATKSRAGSVYLRGDVWWMAYYDAAGKRQLVSTGQRSEAEARKVLKSAMGKERARAEAGAAGDSLAAYAETKWLPTREKMGLSGYRNERTRMTLHVLPRLGAMRLEEVEVRHVIALIRDLKGTLAPRTVRHVVGDLSNLLREAEIDRLIDRNPCELLRRGDLPGVKDADPKWRATAVFSHEEAEQLLMDPRIPLVRRVDYAVAVLTGARNQERSVLRWANWDTERRPLGCLAFESAYSENLRREKETKTGVPRYFPVHPILALMLEEWRTEGWAAVNGRTPGADDLMLPHVTGKRRTNSVMWKGLQADLERLGKRARRVHDFRRTTISLGVADGARKEILKTLTHPSAQQAFDLYLTVPWAVLCSEVARIRIGHPAATPSLRSTVGAAGIEGATRAQLSGTSTGSPSGDWKQQPTETDQRGPDCSNRSNTLPADYQDHAPQCRCPDCTTHDPGGYLRAARRSGLTPRGEA